MNKAQEEIIQEQIEKIHRQLNQPDRPTQQSRAWTHPEGYRYLVQWSNSVLLRHLLVLLTNSFPKTEYRKKAQLDDAGRSVVRDIEEGYKRANTAPYIEFLSYSQGSLEEVKGDIRDITEDGFLASRPGSNLSSIGINLKDLNTALKPKESALKGQIEGIHGDYRKEKIPESDKKLFIYHPLPILYTPLQKIKPTDLTIEIFMELINKTDYLLRVLVQSLEKKMYNEQKGYQVERARIKGRLKDYRGR